MAPQTAPSRLSRRRRHCPRVRRPRMSLPLLSPARTPGDEPPLPADHRHRSRRAEELGLIDAMAWMFGPNGCAQQEGELGIRPVVAQDVPHCLFVVGEEAVPHGAVRGKPESVACATKGFRNARDETDLADPV